MIDGKHPLMELKSDNWAVILEQDGKIKTSYQIEKNKKSFSENQADKGYKVYEQQLGAGIREQLKILFNLP